MFLDRLEMLSVITFLEKAIPKGSETGKNCVFIRVDEGKLIFTAGGQFVTKKAVLIRPNTVEESVKDGKLKPLPDTFMVPKADILAFKKMMEEHKEICKKLAKNDPSYLFVEIFGDELVSHDGRIMYEQPKFEFKDLESVFEITKEPVSEIPIISADLIAATTGFSKRDPVEITFTGLRNPIHFQQGDYEAIILPPVEKEKEKEVERGEDQTTID